MASPFGTDCRTVAFRTWVALLKADPGLAPGMVRTWRAWEGLPEDDDPPRSADCPWVRLTPGPDASGWHSTGVHQMPILVTVETAVEGSNANDLIDFWGALQAGMFPGAQDSPERAAWRDALAAVGITSVEVLRPAYEISRPWQKGHEVTVSEPGQVRLMMHIVT